MRITKRLSLILVLSLVLSCFGATWVSAGSDGTIHIEPESIVVKQGESVVVDLVSDTDLTANIFSAFEWAFDIGSFYVEQEGDSDFLIYIDSEKGNIRIGALESNVEITAGVPFASLRFTALEDARTITRNSNNIKSDVVTSDLEILDVTADDILITITADTPPTPEPVPEPDPTAEPTAEPTAAPTNRPSSGNTTPTATAKPTATAAPTASAAPSATATPAPTGAATPAVQVFADLPATHWAFEYVMDLYAKGIVNGSDDGNFYPDTDITRAEFTKEAVALFDLDVTTGETAFADVPADEWYAPYVGAAVAAGIINGVSETEFAPNDTVTREQMAAIIGRQLKATSETALEYTDAGSISDYAVPYVSALTDMGLLTGDNNMFNPASSATRAEAAALLSRVGMTE